MGGSDGSKSDVRGGGGIWCACGCIVEDDVLYIGVVRVEKLGGLVVGAMLIEISSEIFASVEKVGKANVKEL